MDISTTNVALDNDHRVNGHDAMLPDCPRCRADAEALNMLHLMPPARDLLPQQRMIEVYATGPAEAMEAATIYARDDMGVHINDFIEVVLRRPIERDGKRYIYRVHVTCTVAR